MISEVVKEKLSDKNQSDLVKPTIKQRRRLYLLEWMLGAAAIGILILAFFAKRYEFFPFDLYITRQIQLIQNPLLESILLFISWLGNFQQTIFSVVIVVVLFWILKRRDLALGLLVSATGAVFISETLKSIVSRPRPDPTLVNQIEKFFKDDSFPSGHVLYYMGFYGFLLFATFVLIKRRLWRHILSGVLILMLVLVGVSRIYKGSHWFSDTLASYLIGIIWLYFVVLFFEKFQVKSKKNGK